ncbi:hypothetical protein ACFSTH_08410 [Paenibacillus yanchengensis]|uniref:Copper amine oxidase-like N-terminal domain-containing protein n=1 Tax=Paenibacillus yanchengensis TaxID=2035833 RepID=A0ABW4YLK8_9BACL
MKKYIVGFLAGALIFSGIFLIKDTAIFGEKVEKEMGVILNGESFGRGIVIDGVNYVPLESIADVAGFDVNFNDEKILLHDKKILRIEQLNDELLALKKSLESAYERRDKTENKIDLEEQTINKTKLELAAFGHEMSQEKFSSMWGIVEISEVAKEKYLEKLAKEKDEILELKQKINDIEVELKCLNT